MNLEYGNFTECYIDLINKTYLHNQYTSSPRGHLIKENLGVRFRILDSRDRIPYVIGRRFSLSYMVAELLWYLSGNDKTSWISNYSNFWSTISDDGETANSAYGARLLRSHSKIASGRLNQWEWVKNELVRDPDSRRAVMHIRVPADSLDAKLDMPCTLALQFFIRDNKLEMIVHMRSSDVIFGIAYDIPAFTVLQEIMSLQLSVGLGSYTHVSNSLHIYQRHFEMAEEILSSSSLDKTLKLHAEFGAMPPLPPRWALDDELSYDILSLFNFEACLRDRVDPYDIITFFKASFKNDEDLLYDWGAILTMHRLKKLKHREDARELKSTLNFSGYKFFRR